MEENHSSTVQQAEKGQLFFTKLFTERMPSSVLMQTIHLHQRYQELLRQLLVKPEKLVALQLIYWQELFFLWQRFLFSQSQHVASEAQQLTWQQEPILQLVKDFYLVHVRHLQGVLSMTAKLDEAIQRSIPLHLKQITNVLSSAHFVIRSPTEWWAVLEQQGESLLQCLGQVLHQLKGSPSYV